MTANASSVAKARPPRRRRQAGYTAAIVANGVILFIVNNVVAWDVLPWLTSEFDDVLPILNVSLLASIAANAVYLVFDPPLWRSVCELGLLALSIAAGITLYRVFPFDFSASSFDWDLVTQWLIGLAIVGMCIGFLTGAVKLIVDLARRTDHTNVEV